MKMSGPNTLAIVAMCAVWSCDLPPEPESTATAKSAELERA